MPIKLTDNQALTRATLTFSGGTLEIAYRELTGEDAAQIEALATGQSLSPFDEFRYMVRFIEKHLVEWDLLGDDDQPLPINQDVLMRLPVRWLRDIFQTIIGDQREDFRQPGPGY